MSGECSGTKRVWMQTLLQQRLCLPQSPEDGSKEEAYTDCIEESHAIVLRHPPIGRSILGKHSLILYPKGLWILCVKLQRLCPLLWTAELDDQLVILSARKQDSLSVTEEPSEVSCLMSS